MRNAKKSIVDSLARIIKFNYKDIAEDNIILARVTSVYSDILDTDTFGTMDCYDEINKIEVVDVPLNAHINDDGTNGVSGKYTFPKIGSDIYLALDITGNKETFIPILFSHIDKVYESYNEEKVVEVIEVDTPDTTKPYDTEVTGNSSKSTQSAITFLEELIAPTTDISRVISDNLYQIDVLDSDNQTSSTSSSTSTEVRGAVSTNTGGSIYTIKYNEILATLGNNNGELSDRKQTNTQIDDSVNFQNQQLAGTFVEKDLYKVFARINNPYSQAAIEITPSKITIDGGTGLGAEPAVKGDTLESLLSQLITEVIAVNVAIPSMVAAPTATANLPIIQGQLSTIKNLKIDLS